MSADLLMAATAALRDVGNVGPGPESMSGDPVAEMTRRRVMASLGERKQGNRRRLGFAVFALALSTATLSWAASTGRLKDVLRKLHVVEAAPVVAPREDVPVRERVARVERAAVAVAVPVIVAEPVVEPMVEPVPARKARAKRVKMIVPSPSPSTTTTATSPSTTTVDGDVAAYRVAHGVHFRGGDAGAALAAWDEYLAAWPGGRFVEEAGYNRAITLVRLGRKSEAREALARIAAGTYRREDAIKLREALK